MFIKIILLIVGFILLIKGADVLVDGASSSAQNFGVSKMLIGLTIVAFGTSAPEFAVSIKAISSGSTDMVLGNVFGSNILNILLILGIAAVIRPIMIKDNTIKKELPLCLLISSLLVVLFLDVRLAKDTVNQITRQDAIVILLFFMVFIHYLATLAKQRREKNDDEGPKYKLGTALFMILIGLGGIILGSDMVVNNASGIARILGLSDRVISLTIIAFGTSLPELVTTIVSSKKGEQELLLGNIIGSNIFNACMVLGVPVALFGTITPIGFNNIDLFALVFSALLLFIFATTKRKMSTFEGIIMLIFFAIYYTLVFII